MDPLIGRVIADRYEILQRIGSGGMGSVYRAKQSSVARQVALKVLRPDLINNDHIRQRFHREAEIIARLSHPNTIRLYEFCTTDDGLAVMVMELLTGLPLSERLKIGPLGVAEGIQVGIEVARSLAEAHLLGLVHRDLKPANIFLHEVGNERVSKVLDFGIARLMDEEATRLTVTDQVFGTPRYMSPEQGLSTANVDARSDLYSLGLILYECVVGQPPFVAQTSYQYLSAHSAQPPPKLRASVAEAPGALEALIDACLEKRPEDRPQTAQVVADHLEGIKRALETGTPMPPLPPLHPEPGRPGDTEPTDLDRRPPPEPVEPGGTRVSVGLVLAAAVVALVAIGLAIAQATKSTASGADAAVGPVFAVTPLDAAVEEAEPDAGYADAMVAEPSPPPPPPSTPKAKARDRKADSGKRSGPKRKPRRRKEPRPEGGNVTTEAPIRTMPGFPDSDDVKDDEP